MEKPYTSFGEHLAKVTPVGGAGVAAGSVLTNRKVFGFIYQINIKYTGMPITTTVIVTAPLKNGNVQELADVTGSTDVTISFQLDITDVAGVVTGEKRWPLVLEQHITVAVTNADAGADGVEVSIQVI